MPQIAKCPHCTAPVSIADDADATARVNCPSCQGDFLPAEISISSTADSTTGDHPDALGFLQVVTGEVPAEEATSTNHLAFLQAQPAVAPSPEPVVPVPESRPDTTADSPSHATTYRELFGVDPPSHDSLCDRPSAMEAFDFDFLRNSGVVPASEVSDEPDTLASVVVPGVAEAAAVDAAPAAVEPPVDSYPEAAQESIPDASVAGESEPIDVQSVTMLVVEPAPSVDLVEIATAAPTVVETETANPATTGESMVAGSEPEAEPAATTITPQRSFFQFAMATVDPAAASESIVAAADLPAAPPGAALATADSSVAVADFAAVPSDVALATADSSVAAADSPPPDSEDAVVAATTVEATPIEDGEYPMAADSEAAEPDGAFDVEGEEFGGLSTAEPRDDTAAIPLPRERLPRRKQKPTHPIRNIVGLVTGGFCGLFLGYSLLCLIFGAEIDALHIYYKEPPVVRHSRAPSASREDGRPKSPFEILEEQQAAKNAKHQ